MFWIFFFHVLPSIFILTNSFQEKFSYNIETHVGYVQKRNFALNSSAYNV